MEWRRQLKGLSSSWQWSVVLIVDTMCAEIQKGTQTLDRAGVLPAQCPLWVKRELMELLHLMCAQARMQLGLFISVGFGDPCFWKLISRVGLKWNPLCP